ncbi:uncharacterized protein LOC131063316 [Cryptomeria japonica]|uniref:uncharacterized protein LOC131063316 n=1 Tax=Cryptomeria japonica TaxID=3369 RepID=UPI0027D9DCED|nr:uncharacterized protein LOC131063316 [Cryptomeria japonica]
MHFLKNKLKTWNKLSFKNIFVEKTRIEEELEDISNHVMAMGMTNKEFKAEELLKDQYSEILKRDELYWKEKSRELWIADGELNTKKFNASSKAKRLNNKIGSIKDGNGNVCTLQKDIEQSAIDYFTGLLGSGNIDTNSTYSLIDEVIETLLTDEDCAMLQAPSTLEDIKNATFSLHPHKAPGPNGITAECFQKCWDFMGQDIWLVVEEFKKK